MANSLHGSQDQQAILDKIFCLEMDRQARPVDLRVQETRKNHFVPPVPMRIVECVERAGAMSALGLILAIHRQLTMRRCDSTPLNAAIWRAAGSPSKKRREAILRNLAKLPEVFLLYKARSRQGFYRVARGELWANN